MRISPKISDDAFQFLINNGLEVRFSKACEKWRRSKSASDKDYELSIKEKGERMRAELAKDAGALENTILRALLDRVSENFPYVYTCDVDSTIDVVL